MSTNKRINVLIIDPFFYVHFWPNEELQLQLPKAEVNSLNYMTTEYYLILIIYFIIFILPALVTAIYRKLSIGRVALIIGIGCLTPIASLPISIYMAGWGKFGGLIIALVAAVIPLCLALIFESMKCQVCGEKTRINWGDSKIILCQSDSKNLHS